MKKKILITSLAATLCVLTLVIGIILGMTANVSGSASTTVEEKEPNGFVVSTSGNSNGIKLSAISNPDGFPDSRAGSYIKTFAIKAEVSGTASSNVLYNVAYVDGTVPSSTVLAYSVSSGVLNIGFFEYIEKQVVITAYIKDYPEVNATCTIDSLPRVRSDTGLSIQSRCGEVFGTEILTTGHYEVDFGSYEDHSSLVTVFAGDYAARGSSGEVFVPVTIKVCLSDSAAEALYEAGIEGFSCDVVENTNRVTIEFPSVIKRIKDTQTTNYSYNAICYALRNVDCMFYVHVTGELADENGDVYETISDFIDVSGFDWSDIPEYTVWFEDDSFTY